MIGRRIKHLRKEMNLLQKDLAEKLNLTQQTISLYESEKRQPDYETLQKIANFFNVSVDYLLGRTDEKKIILDSVNDASIEYYADNKIIKDINGLSPESKKDLEEYIKLLKLRDMQKRYKENSDELATLD